MEILKQVAQFIKSQCCCIVKQDVMVSSAEKKAVTLTLCVKGYECCSKR